MFSLLYNATVHGILVSWCVHLVVEGVAEAAVLLHGHMHRVLDTAALPVTTGPHQQLLPCTQAS